RVLNGLLVEHVAGGGVHLVDQRGGDDVDSGGDGSDFELAVDGGGAGAFDEDGGMVLGLEAFLGDGQAVVADGEIGNEVRAVDECRDGDFEIGVEVFDDDSSGGNGRAGRVGDRA